MALTDDEVAALASDASYCLQQLQNEFGKSSTVASRVRFPRGYLSTAQTLRRTLPAFGTELQRRNASYTAMHGDALRWLIVKTDISGSALSMIVKNVIGVCGALCEWMLKEATRGRAGCKSYKLRTKKLASMTQITNSMKDDLDWIWDVRCNSHLSKIDGLEHDMYSRADFNRAIDAYKKLRNILVTKFGSAV